MIIRRVAALLIFIAPLAACVSGSDSTPASPNPNAAFTARFAPLAGIMPFPNDLYFNGSTTGTLNIPGSALVAQNAPLLALNHLDGYGTESDISIYFTEPVDATTLTTGVVVLQVTSDPTTKAVTGFTKALVPGTDYSIGLSPGIDAGGDIVTIKPLKPLTPSTVTGGTTVVPATYLVIVTTGVKNSTGTPVAPSSDFSAVVAADLPALSPSVNPANINMPVTNPLFPVAEFTLGQLAVAAGAGVTPDKVAVTFSFSTAYLGLSLAELSASATATAQPTGANNATAIIDTGKSVCDVLALSGQLPNNTTACANVPGSDSTEVFAGTVALPYYLTVPATGSKAAITDSWHNAAGGDTAISTNPASLLPKATTTANIIPILVALPKGSACGAMPTSGWPTVIFQHGITRNREDMLGIASTLVLGAAPFCTAVVAIDLPLHGVTSTTDPFYQNQLFAATLPNLVTGERTFNMDATGAAGAAGSAIDGSGQLFINLNSTLTSRDNLREGAADLINLAATLPTLTAITPGASPVVNKFDGSKFFYVGHSLGGIVGTVFLGADAGGHLLLGGPSRIVAASLANPGGHIAELLRNSAEFEPIIDTQLAANGLVKGSQSYYDFYSEAQTVVEDGDPANYAALAIGGHPIHLLEVVGGLAGASDTCNLPDQVVPNSSTELLASLMGSVATTEAPGTGANFVPGGKPIVRFLAGDHGSVLSPAVPGSCTNNGTNQLIYGAVTQEMQTEIISFIASAGTAVKINNTAGILK